MSMSANSRARTTLGQKLYTLLGIISLILGILSTGWLVAMSGQWLLPWSSLSVMAPPGAPPPGSPPR